ncbi:MULTISPECIES: thioesterase family protein [Mumia]|uniref:thioesterase family protein n=1 Tax=Mumia TaxID=1546255 RepID=UPI001424020F|nr:MULTISPECIES: thioesterase family protein [unclassified Mumia]QMW67661.1 thioesterase family protein [Mumia sp. ZJ1417]
MTARPHPFHDVSAVRATTDGFEAEVDPEWCVGEKPNGGYLLAMLARAATLSAGHAHVVTASAHYLHSPDPGPVEIETTVLRKGRSADHVRATMRQDGRPCVEAVLMIGQLDVATTPYWDRGAPPRPTADREHGVRVPGTSPTGVRIRVMDQVDLRLDPATLGFGAGRPSGSGELRGWLAFLDDAAFEPVSLLYAVDSFPPATFEIAPTDWVPTLEMTAYVRALPVPGPLTILHRAQLVEAQRVDESTFVWDRAGRLVAQATQLAGVRLG